MAERIMTAIPGLATRVRTRVNGRQLKFEYGIFVVLAVAGVASSVAVPQFATGTNAKALLVSVSIQGLVAVGMTLVVISGSLVDLSVPAQVALSSILVLSLESHGAVIAILAGIGSALACGLVNGVLISAGGNPVLVTLALQTIVFGVAVGLNGGSAVYGTPGNLQRFANASVGSVPVLVLLFLGIALVMQLILRQTRFGFEIYSTGANRAAARVSGVPVRRILLVVFLISAALAGLAGALAGAYGAQADGNVGSGYEFYALTAVVVGGTSLFGGRGNVANTVAGVLLVGLINNVMILLGLPTNLQLVVMGFLLVAIVGPDAYFRRGDRR